MMEQQQSGGESPIAIFFSYGFRTFFLTAGIYAVLAMVPWLSWISSHIFDSKPLFLPESIPLHLWHAHEMIFAYAAAVITGFLLTAIPNWTATKPVKGRLLILLFTLWLLGRAGLWATDMLPPAVTALLDLLFIPAVAAIAYRHLSQRPAPRNMIFLVLLGTLFVSNLLFHLSRTGNFDLLDANHSLRLGLDTVILIITIIGGRVVPAFTRNAISKLAPGGREPKQHAVLDISAIALVAALAIANLTELKTLSAILALSAAAANAVRLYEWRSPALLREPLIWVLHLGYAWLVIGLTLHGLSALDLFISPTTALHALSVGAIGTMTLAVMSRATLGHTGRPLHAQKPIVVAYILVTISALIRICAPGILPDLYFEMMLLSGLIWIAALAIFTTIFAPILLSPRLAS